MILLKKSVILKITLLINELLRLIITIGFMNINYFLRINLCMYSSVYGFNSRITMQNIFEETSFTLIYNFYEGDIDIFICNVSMILNCTTSNN